jgi:hypothetical protein
VYSALCAIIADSELIGEIEHWAKQMRSTSQRIRWLCLGIAAVFLVAGVVAAKMSASATVFPLTLSVGESVTVSVLRLLPGDFVSIELGFDRDMPHGYKASADLGYWQTKEEGGFLEFDLPGEPIVIQVRAASTTVDFEALPAGSRDHERVYREIVPRVGDDGDLRRFPWPPDSAARPQIPPGRSMLTLTVVEVGRSLSGEKVTAILIPPLTEKFVRPNYGFLWWFLVLWPVMTAPLACWAAYLLWQARRSRVANR